MTDEKLNYLEPTSEEKAQYLKCLYLSQLKAINGEELHLNYLKLKKMSHEVSALSPTLCRALSDDAYLARQYASEVFSEVQDLSVVCEAFEERYCEFVGAGGLNGMAAFIAPEDRHLSELLGNKLPKLLVSTTTA